MILIGMDFAPPHQSSSASSTLDADFAELEDILSMIETIQIDLRSTVGKQHAHRQLSIDSKEAVTSFRQSFFNPSLENACKEEDLDELLVQINQDRQIDTRPIPLITTTSNHDSGLLCNGNHLHPMHISVSPIRELQTDFQIDDLPPPSADLLENFAPTDPQLNCPSTSPPLPPPPPPLTPSPRGKSTAGQWDAATETIAAHDFLQKQMEEARAIKATVKTEPLISPNAWLHSDTGVSKKALSEQSIAETLVNNSATGNFNPSASYVQNMSNETAPAESTGLTRRHSGSSSGTSTCNTNEDVEVESPEAASWKVTDEIRAKADHVEGLLRETNLTKLVARIHRSDRTTKAVLISERTIVGQLCSTVADKNHEVERINHAVVEKVPDMKMERIIEDHECLLDTIRAWPENSRNILFFEEKVDKFGPFTRPEKYLPNVAAREDEFYEKFCNRIIQTIFDGQHLELPDLKDTLYIKKPGHGTWIRRLCTLRCSGIYASKKNRFTTTALTDVACITPFHDYLHLYASTGGWCKDKKVKAPTPFGFALKPLHVQRRESAQVLYFCAVDESSLRRWIALIRIAKLGHQFLNDFHAAQERCKKTASQSAFLNVCKMSAPLARVCQTLPRAKAKMQQGDDAVGNKSTADEEQFDFTTNKLRHGSHPMRTKNHVNHVRAPLLPIDTSNAKQLVTAFAQQCDTGLV